MDNVKYFAIIKAYDIFNDKYQYRFSEMHENIADIKKWVDKFEGNYKKKIMKYCEETDEVKEVVKAMWGQVLTSGAKENE